MCAHTQRGRDTDTHAHTSQKSEILHFEKFEVKDQILRPLKYKNADCIGVVGHRKGHFISFEVSMK
jgi:hypothetical protein